MVPYGPVWEAPAADKGEGARVWPVQGPDIRSSAERRGKDTETCVRVDSPSLLLVTKGPSKSGAIVTGRKRSGSAQSYKACVAYSGDGGSVLRGAEGKGHKNVCER